MTHLYSPSEGLLLLPLGDSSVATNRPDVALLAGCLHDHLGLGGQLPGGGETKDLGLPHSGVNALENGAGERSGLSCSGLSLSDDITTLHNGLDSSLLDGGGLLESVGINSSE